MSSHEFLYNIWYVAGHGGAIKKGKTLAKMLLGQKILFGRDNKGIVFALRDFCPHRGVPLSYGTFDGENIQCCFHGWVFNPQGVCTKIPSLTEDSKIDCARVKAQSYPCREVHGVIWIYIPTPGTKQIENIPEIPATPIPLARDYRFVTAMTYPCNIDDGALSLVDPTHNQLVHNAWWWRSKRSIHPKQKHFVPYKLGYRMERHKPSKNYRAYKVFGQMTTELTFQLPATRTEHMMLGKHHMIFFTAMTPVTDRSSELNQFFYTTSPFIRLLTPILAIFGRAFIKQDYQILEKQREGLDSGEHSSGMLLGDGDQQGVWYLRLKKDMIEAQQNNTPFENRIQEKTLRWYS